LALKIVSFSLVWVSRACVNLPLREDQSVENFILDVNVLVARKEMAKKKTYSKYEKSIISKVTTLRNDCGE